MSHGLRQFKVMQFWLTELFVNAPDIIQKEKMHLEKNILFILI